MYLLAKDGIYINDYPRSLSETKIPAGGRADLMVRCSTAGTYTIKTGTTELATISASGTTVTTSALTTWKPASIPDYLTDLTGT